MGKTKYTLSEITTILNNIGLILLSEYTNTNQIHEYKCISCNHTFSTGLKFKISQHKKNIKGCPKCSMNERIKKLTTKKNGISRADEIARKSAKTMNENGTYKKTGAKIKKTVNKINPNTGESLAKSRGQKTRKTKSIKQKCGKSLYEITAIKSAKTQRRKNYLNYCDYISHNINDYTLLTTEEEYINQSDNIIKYQHSCGEIRESYWPYIRCLKCYPYNKSIAENEILEYCKSFTNTISNDRQLIKPKELDIVLPDFKLAIEYNGLFWHSSGSIETEVPEYHLSKTQECNKHGYQLFHIFENEWEDPIKKDIWKSIISNKLGQSDRLYARKCKIHNVDIKDVRTFLKSNHLQGYVPSSINLGLFYQDELVSLMTFGKSRYGKKYDWELLRFCNKKYTSVIGGASRLFKNFIKSNKGIIVSYADMRRSTGNIYNKLGFELSHISEPNYWYWDKKNGLVLESRIKYQKHKLGNILEEYDANLTESENMYNNNYRKIFDCGNQIWIYKIT